jgi:hypothetical protein
MQTKILDVTDLLLDLSKLLTCLLMFSWGESGINLNCHKHQYD